MKKPKICPKCGKEMEEELKFPGLWRCPDYKKPMNDRPPYRYKCSGIYITKKGADDFYKLLNRMAAERN